MSVAGCRLQVVGYLRILGRYFSIAHCMVSLYKSVSSREKMPSGSSARSARVVAMFASEVGGKVVKESRVP